MINHKNLQFVKKIVRIGLKSKQTLINQKNLLNLNLKIIIMINLQLI
jgi:hypothetical protein